MRAEIWERVIMYSFSFAKKSKCRLDLLALVNISRLW